MVFISLLCSMQPQNELLSATLKTLPENPGVYEMKNEEGETLYVGKAKNLKNRVRTYFQNGANHSARIQKMLEKVCTVEWTTVSSEWEALVLESNLIKQKKPRFNVLLRDDKNFSYIRVSVQEDFPMITLSRRIIKDGALYFGPKTSATAVRKTIDFLQEILRFRTTPLDLQYRDGTVIVKNPGNTKYPCLNYHLKKCDAPCIGNISPAEYRKKVDQAISFLKGDILDLEIELQTKMKGYASEGKFEMAAKTRDYLFSLQSIAQKQLVSAPTEFSSDIIGMHSQFGHVFFHVFSFRHGKLINSETFPMSLSQKEIFSEDIQECVDRFLQDYSSYSPKLPESLIISDSYIADKKIWQEYFMQHFDAKIDIIMPQKGDKKTLLDLATENAQEYAKRHAISFLKHEEDAEEILIRLQKQLSMQKLPKRIECYDISHFSGEKTYASMVVFENGEAKNKDYRIFSIQSLEPRKIDDFSSLKEAIARRLARLPSPMPSEWQWQKITRKKDLLHIYSQNIPEEIPELWGIFEQSTIESTQENTNIENDMPRKEKLLLEDSVFSVSYPQEDILRMTLVDTFHQKYIPYFPHFLKKYKNFNIYISGIGDFEDLSFEKQSETHWQKSKGVADDASFSACPDLIVIDGGKGQLSSTYSVLQHSPYADAITMVSLAKDQEEVFVPMRSDSIGITRFSPEGKLLQRIRDEAHRFAITKNRTEREKVAKRSILDEIKGLGPKTKKQLKSVFGSVSAIAAASDEELLAYISSTVLKELRQKI